MVLFTFGAGKRLGEYMINVPAMSYGRINH
jgi:hypothetical protein